MTSTGPCGSDKALLFNYDDPLNLGHEQLAADLENDSSQLTLSIQKSLAKTKAKLFLAPHSP
jgi:hypothetical protein